MVVHCNSKVYIYIYILCCIHTGQNILIFSFSFLFFSFSPHFSILYIAPLSSLFISLVASSSSFTHHQPKPLPSIDLHSLRFSPLSLSLSLSLSLIFLMLFLSLFLHLKHKHHLSSPLVAVADHHQHQDP